MGSEMCIRDSSYGVVLVDEVDDWIDSGSFERFEPCGTTACTAGYIVFTSREFRENQSCPEESILRYAARVLDIPDKVTYCLFDSRRSADEIIVCLEAALEYNHW